eukprot:134664_1
MTSVCKTCNGLSAYGIGGCQSCGGSGVYKKHHTYNHTHIKSKHHTKKTNRFNGAKYYKPKRNTYPCHGHKVIRLYHQTDQKGATAIQKSAKMIRGSQGMLGAGIYFAETKSATNKKALHSGYKIIADVFVGKVKIVSKPTNKDKKESFYSLWKQGYDSIRA